MKIVTPIEYGQLFNDKPKSVIEYLKGINKSRIIKILVYLINDESNKELKKDVNLFVNNYFSKENKIIKNEILLKLERIKSIDSKNYYITDTVELLKLLEIVLEIEQSDQDFIDDNTAEINIFKAILLENTKLGEKQIHNYQSVKSESKIDKFNNSIIAISIGNWHTINFNILDITALQIHKAVYLFKFLENNNKELLNNYLHSLGCKHWKVYVDTIVRIVMIFIESNSRQLDKSISLKELENKEFLENFLRKFSISNFTSTNNTNYSIFKKQPFIDLGNGVFIPIFYKFVSELIFNSIYFNLKDLNQESTSNQIKNFRQYYTTNFSEKRIFYDILNQIYKNNFNSCITLTEEEFVKFNNNLKSKPDYYLRKGNKTFIFECKDTNIDSKIIDSGNFEEIELALKERLYTKSDGKDAAAIQLLKSILQISSSVVYESNRKIIKEITNIKQTFYPIIIVHNDIYNTPGINKLINSWFEFEVSKHYLNNKTEKLKQTKIKKITLIHIDSLIYYGELLKSKKVLLENMIDDYQKYMASELKSELKGEISISKSNKRTISFSDYIPKYLLKQDIMYRPKNLLNDAMELYKDSDQ